MSLIFADPSLRLKADSSTAWHHYLVPELQKFWVTPLIFAHSEFARDMQRPMVRTAFGQETPTPLEIKGLFRHDSRGLFEGSPEPQAFTSLFETVSGECERDFAGLTGLGSRDCVFLRDADFAQIRAAINWLRGFSNTARPKMIIQPATKQLGSFLARAEDEKRLEIAALKVREALVPDLQQNLKLIATEEPFAAFLEALLQHPVERWPSVLGSRTVRANGTGARSGRLVAIVGNQRPEKGSRVVPALASMILDRFPDAAMLVHNGLGPGTLDIEDELLALERTNRRLVTVREAMPFERWWKVLSSIDLAILPYDPDVYRNRGSRLFDELLANGVPTIVPAHTALAARAKSFNVPDKTFEEFTSPSIVEAASNALSDYEATRQQARAAQELWAKTQGPQRFVINLLSWFPEPRKQWTGWGKQAEAGCSQPFRSANRSKRILLSWSVDPGYIPPPKLSDNQVTIGPHPLATCKTYLRPNQWGSYDAYAPYLHTYDLKEILKLQGIAGPFDLVVVFAETAFGNVPFNVGSFGCPSLLFAGDTHWGSGAVGRMVDYSVAAEFDFVVTTYNRQHLHWYLEAGKHRLAWIPALATQHFPQPFRPDKKKRLAFVGQTQELHLRRGRLLKALQRAGFTADPKPMNRMDAAALYNSSAVSFNASMNGDLNLRTFEVMSAGGCLLTDRLAPESGQTALFEEGQHYLGYSSEEEMLEQVSRCFSRPSEASRIAHNGHKAYTERYLPEHQVDALLNWVFSGKLKSEYDYKWDTRPRLAAETDPLPLKTRFAVYERLQEAHRVLETVHVLVGPGVPCCVISDLIDLPRVACTVLEGEKTVRPVLRRFGLENRVKYINSRNCAETKARWNYLILGDDADEIKAAIPHQEAIIAKAAAPALLAY